MPRVQTRGRQHSRRRHATSKVCVSWPNAMAAPGTRDHGHHQVKEAKDTLKTAVAAMDDQGFDINASLLSTDSDDDADVSDPDDDSEDDGGSDDGEDNQGKDVDELPIAPHGTTMRGEPAAQTSFDKYVHSTGQERKISKRLAEEDFQPDYQQSTRKKRKALLDISEANYRTNALAGAFEAPEARSASSERKQVIATVARATTNNIQQKPQVVPPSSRLCASRSGMNWPRIQNSTEFTGTILAEQRAELIDYRKILFDYADMIQAGAIPVEFVKSFLERLDTHIEQMDGALHGLELLHNKQNKRLGKLAKLYNAAKNDHAEAEELILALSLPAKLEPL